MNKLQIISLFAFLIVLPSCSRSSSSVETNSSAKEFTTTNGSTVHIGAVKVDNTNVPLTNVQVK
jgi:hypothetical protein